jgi:hypothetical protein
LFCSVGNRPAQSSIFEGMHKGMPRRRCNLYPQNAEAPCRAFPHSPITQQEDVCPS